MSITDHTVTEPPFASNLDTSQHRLSVLKVHRSEIGTSSAVKNFLRVKSPLKNLFEGLDSSKIAMQSRQTMLAAKKVDMMTEN